jgi:hypothetical protein
MVFACSAAVLGALMAPAALAQSNPFVPPKSSVSKAEIEAMIRQEMLKQAASQKGAPSAPGVEGQMKDQGVMNAPQGKGGTPSASTASKENGKSDVPDINAPDAVADLLKDGGSFVGCVEGTPIFKDRIGRRAYFTTKELRESNEARRYARCR